MFKHILAPHDGSPLSDRTLARAVELARTLGARLTVFNATAEAPYPVTNFGEEGRYDPERARRFTAEADAHGRAIVAPAAEQARAAGVAVDIVLKTSDNPHLAIIETAEERGCDLIVMASHGRRGINALLLGSETNKVLTHCRIPVLVCR
jgi:nucleotide-binding universal stress UspA family protein